MSLLRLFIPSWRFFDQIGTIPKLYYRVKSASDYTPWVLCLEKPAGRNFFNFLLNANGNFYLTCLGLIDRLVSEEHNSEIQSTVSYKLVENLVRNKVISENSNAKSFQFKIQVKTENKVQYFLMSDEVFL